MIIMTSVAQVSFCVLWLQLFVLHYYHHYHPPQSRLVIPLPQEHQFNDNILLTDTKRPAQQCHNMRRLMLIPREWDLLG